MVSATLGGGAVSPDLTANVADVKTSKPGAVTMSRYSPDGSPVKLKLPSAALVAVRSHSLPAAARATSAPGTALPWASRTTPATWAVPWASAAGAAWPAGMGASGRGPGPIRFWPSTRFELMLGYRHAV